VLLLEINILRLTTGTELLWCYWFQGGHKTEQYTDKFIPELSQIWYTHSGADKADYMGLSYCTPPHH